MAAILNFGRISTKSLAHPHVVRNVALTRKRDVGQNPGATKIHLPLQHVQAGDNKKGRVKNNKD